MNTDRLIARIAVNGPWLWLFIFALIPLCMMLAISFLSTSDVHIATLPVTLSHYIQLFEPRYLSITFQSFVLAFFATLLCAVIAYPLAYILTSLPERFRHTALLFMMVPFWTNSVVRTYGIMILLKAKGIINQCLLGIGLIHSPLPLLFSNTAVIIGLVYHLLPFMIMPLYVSLDHLDPSLLEAAKDLGASPWTRFRRVLLPLTWPGLVSGCTLVFLPAMTLFFVPVMLGGRNSMMLGNVIQNQFLQVHNWPLGCATSMMLTGTLIVLYALYHSRHHKHQQTLAGFPS